MKKVLILCMALILAGCTNTPLSVISAATNVSYTFENGDVLNYLDNAALTDEELTTVLLAIDTYDEAKKSLKVYKQHPQILVSNLGLVNKEYVRIRERYLAVYRVVEANWDEYSVIDQYVLEDFHRSVTTLDEAFNELVRQNNNLGAISTAIRIADTAAKLAMLL